MGDGEKLRGDMCITEGISWSLHDLDDGRPDGAGDRHTYTPRIGTHASGNVPERVAVELMGEVPCSAGEPSLEVRSAHAVTFLDIQ